MTPFTSSWSCSDTTQVPPAGALPLELLSTVLSFLTIQAIAVCACVSRHRRKAAAQAVPRRVEFYDSRESSEVSYLLEKSCALSSVEIVKVFYSEEPYVHFMKGALLARICAEATALEAVFM